MTTQPVIQERYKSDHLFLLVGTNPLPNFVAATLMLRSQGQLYLVHSDKTKAVAERLERYWTATKQQPKPQFVCVDESDGANIRQHINNALAKIRNGQIGLNYTGGTKTMAVHATRAMLGYQERNHRPVTLSYLDARSNRMYIEHDNDTACMTEPLLYEVQPSIQDIVKLHAFELVSGIETQAILPDLAATLATLHQNDSAGREWRAWCDTVLRRQTRNEKGWCKEAELSNARLQVPINDSLKPFIDALTQKGVIVQNGEIAIQQAYSSLGLTKRKYLCEWLDGKWLEHYVFHTLQQIKNSETHIHDIGMGIRPKSEPNSPEYDIDIGVMQGYRLYAISCTTDADPGMCKLKLFEAYVRARNMAGDEAFVGLICMTDKPENLERQVGRAWDAEGKVRVFGRKHLSYLANDLADWFISAGAQNKKQRIWSRK